MLPSKVGDTGYEFGLFLENVVCSVFQQLAAYFIHCVTGVQNGPRY